MRSPFVLEMPLLGINRPPSWRGTRALLMITVFLALTGCKIVITVPEGGRVVSENGEICLAGQTCIVEVPDTAYDDQFQAIADDSHIFTVWRKRPRSFCGDTSGTCRLLTAFFTGNATFEAIIASDQEFYLEPVFVKRSRYNVDQWAALLDEVDRGTFTRDNFLYQLRPNVANCDPGSLTQDATSRFLEAVNLIRALHNLPLVDYDAFFDSQVQQASLVQQANGYLSHHPDPADLCYTAAADTGAQTSNLYGGSQPEDPAFYAMGWTNDNRNLAAVMEAGHRRWVLYPELGYTSFGVVVGSSAMKVSGFNQSPRIPVSEDLEYVAFPYMEYPYIMVEKGSFPTPWSISIVPAGGGQSDFDYFSSAGVTVTPEGGGTPLPVHSVHVDSRRFGLANFLSWMVDDWEYDTAYTVTVSGISMPGGGVETIEYRVLLDRFNLLNIMHKLERSDTQQGGSISGSFKDDNDKDSYVVDLSGSTQFSLGSNLGAGGFFVLVYNAQKQLLATIDSATQMNIAAGSYTLVLSPCDTDGLCYLGVEEYTLSVD